jgi:NAD(P)-dependent dehydrogenase (short-subunit alcohol dehydrogenase family)
MTSIDDKVVFITGAASGVGAEVARRLYDKGASLVLADLDKESLEEFAASFESPQVIAAPVDVRDLAALQRLADQAIEKFGGIDVVIANAGIGVSGTVLNVDPRAFQTGIDVNVMGVFKTVRATLPSIIERRGYILVVSSMAAYGPLAGSACYTLTKAGVEHFANALRLEVAHHGVDVGTAHMSWIDTPLVRESAELAAFRATIAEMPMPLNKIASVEACGAAFVKGIERRKSRINYPNWVGLMRWLKPVLTSRAALPLLAKGAGERLALLDAETAQAGRNLSARIDKLHDK